MSDGGTGYFDPPIENYRFLYPNHSVMSNTGFQIKSNRSTVKSPTSYHGGRVNTLDSPINTQMHTASHITDNRSEQRTHSENSVSMTQSRTFSNLDKSNTNDKSYRIPHDEPDGNSSSASD